MTGGLLNIVSYGNLNIIINGNPKRNFFTATYKKYTNFGLQKHVINCNVTNTSLRENNPSTFQFTIPRIGDLVADTFFCIDMPHIWSPVFVEPTDIYDCPGGKRLYEDGSGVFNDCSFSSSQTTKCNDYTCTPENSDNFACGNKILTQTDCIGFEDECIPVPKLLDGLYNIDDHKGSGTFFPRKNGSPHAPYVQGFEFKWIKNLGTQLLKNIQITAGGLLLNEFSGDYLMNVVNRDFSKEKKELFDEMTGNIKKLNDPGNADGRRGLYPNSLFGAPLMSTFYNFDKQKVKTFNDFSNSDINSFLEPFLYQYRIYENIDDLIYNDYKFRTNLNPSIFKRSLCIPLNFWYMYSSTQAFPLISMSENQLRINIECRAIRELFVVRDLRNWINTYYHHSFAKGEITQTGAGKSIYEAYDPDYYFDGGKFFSQKDIFKSYVEPPYISTMGTVDPLYQMYMFTTQYAAQNQQLVKQAVLQSKLTADALQNLSNQGIWNARPRLVCTYVYLDQDEQQVFKQKSQSYLIKQIQEYYFEKKNHKAFSVDRFKSNGIVSNWMWYKYRSDIDLRNEWSNYTNWDYNDSFPYTLQPMFHTELSSNWYNNNNQPQLETVTIDTANPNPKPNSKPELNKYITSTTLPENNRSSKYSLQIPKGMVDTYYWLSYLGDENSGINPGAVNIWPEMDKLPPYFPYTFKKSGVSFNNPLRYQNGINPYITGPLRLQNKKTISKMWGLTFDGKLREDSFSAEYYNLVEPFLRCNGNTVDGLYVYNFGLNTNPYNLEPMGAMNLLEYRHIDFESITINSEKYTDLSSVGIIPICSDNNNLDSRLPNSYNKVDWQIYQYSYNLKIMEEQYNYLTISNGLVSLKYTSTR